MEIQGTVDRVIDGDTFVSHLTVLPGIELHGIHIRVAKINAPEQNTVSGKVATEYARTLLTPDRPFTLTTTSLDKYGRVLGVVTFTDGTNFGEQMIKAGYASAYK